MHPLIFWLLATVFSNAEPVPLGGELEAPVANEFLRGMTVSCPRWGPIWGTPAMGAALEDLRTLGVDWVAIHPYAGVAHDGSLRLHPTSETPFLDRAVGIAAEHGIRLFWKPHLAYWGSFSWRGDIRFESDAQWNRFFADYERFLLDQARFAERHQVPILAIGVELDATLHHQERWHRLITAVRQVYSGRLTYAANWDAVAQVPFWNEVDLIGVQAYFPIVDPKTPITETTVAEGWQPHLDALKALSRRYDRPVLFTEIGYARSATNGSAPWQPGMSSSDGVVDQRRLLLEGALQQFAEAPWIAGAFWWKWMPGNALRGHDGDFSMKDPEARAALQRFWVSSEAENGHEPTASSP